MFKSKPEKRILSGSCETGFSSHGEDTQYTMKRERGKTPEGISMNHRWVLRLDGEFVDVCQFRTDLCERNNLELVDYSPEPPPLKEQEK